jgi:hypothetical protein
MPSNDSSRSKSRGDSSWKVKLVKLSAVGSLLISLSTTRLDGHKITSDYELTPIALPGASGIVPLDYFAYDRSTGADSACRWLRLRPVLPLRPMASFM